MKFKGLLLKESLKDLEVLKLIKIVKEEKWDIPKERLADYQPNIWNAVYYEGDEKDYKTISKKLSKAMNSKWYINMNTPTKEIVIFPEKIFEYEKGNKQKKEEAIKYGKSLGIPEKQLDW